MPLTTPLKQMARRMVMMMQQINTTNIRRSVRW
jgi:hypothetical protein